MDLKCPRGSAEWGLSLRRSRQNAVVELLTERASGSSMPRIGGHSALPRSAALPSQMVLKPALDRGRAEVLTLAESFPVDAIPVAIIKLFSDTAHWTAVARQIPGNSRRNCRLQSRQRCFRAASSRVHRRIPMLSWRTHRTYRPLLLLRSRWLPAYCARIVIHPPVRSTLSIS